MARQAAAGYRLQRRLHDISMTAAGNTPTALVAERPELCNHR